jgi:hypothetical protein
MVSRLAQTRVEDRCKMRTRTSPRESSRRDSVLLCGGGVAVDPPSRKACPLPAMGQDHERLSAIRPLCVPMRPKLTNAEGPSVEPSEAPMRAYRLLCECSYKVLCCIIRHGERLGELAFFDDDEASVTRGERVWYCPGCRSRLGLLSLQPRSSTRRQLELS